MEMDDGEEDGPLVGVSVVGDGVSVLGESDGVRDGLGVGVDTEFIELKSR